MLPSSLKFAAFLLLVLFASCKNDELVFPIAPSEPRIKKISVDYNNYRVFNYENGLLSKYEKVANGRSLQAIIPHYNIENQLEWEEQSIEETKTVLVYSYDSNKRIDKATWSIEGENRYYLKYHYNQKNQIILTEQYIIDESEPFYKIEFDYDLSGNVREKRMFFDNNLEERRIFDYDNSINPYYCLRKNLFYDITYSKNNITQEIIISRINNAGQITPRVVNYTYDEHNYPIQGTVESIPVSSNAKTVENYEYD